ncbi:hypothetical protein Cgig2_010917 [Carnegiea gigantea]|uniref:Uncharacterized protein n=1 Tax=Carnegiea gigantea TaxID=171969 RepID=A0A9Q1QBS9_9CARY|nr:hypothetical protein Cgig2_010917 [Carnegiea gigantea]
MLALAFNPQLRSQVTSVMKTIHYGGWTDDTYLLALPPGREAAKLNIKLTTLNELNGIIYEVPNATTVNHRGFTSHAPPVTCQDVRIYVWNCRGLARASFRPNLFTMTSITGSYMVVLTDTCVGIRYARRLLDEAHDLNYYYREPLGFVGGVVILCDNSKVEVYGFTGPDMDMSCILKDEVACDYFHLIDPDYPERTKEVIGDVICEHALERDCVLGDCNAQLWTRKDDMRINAERLVTTFI